MTTGIQNLQKDVVDLAVVDPGHLHLTGIHYIPATASARTNSLYQTAI